MSKPTLLFIGNYLQSKKFNKNVWHYLSERIADGQYDVITTSNKIPKLVRLFDMIWTIMHKSKQYSLSQIDVFSGSAFLWAEICSLLLRFYKKPIILVLHGGGLPEFASKHPHRIRHLLNSAVSVIAPSVYLKEKLSQYYENIQIIPNPIDISSYTFRQRKQIKPSLIWVRAFHKIYNPKLAVDILYELLKFWPDSMLSMVGPDKGDRSLQLLMTQADYLNINDHLIIAGKIPHEQVSDWHDQADIFINTTNFDNTPLSLIEAMASGLCIVTTNVGGISYLVEDQKEALLVPPNEPRAMLEAVKELMNNPGLAATLSKNARKKAESMDWSRILPQWISLYNQVLQDD